MAQVNSWESFINMSAPVFGGAQGREKHAGLRLQIAAAQPLGRGKPSVVRMLFFAQHLTQGAYDFYIVR